MVKQKEEKKDKPFNGQTERRQKRETIVDIN